MPGLLLHSPQRIVAALIAAHGFGTDAEEIEVVASEIPPGTWPIYVDREPDEPDDIIKVSGTVGIGHGDCQVDSERQEHHGIQVMIRAARDAEGFRKCNQIAVHLDRINRELVTIPNDEAGTGTGDTVYQVAAITRTSDPTYLGRDTPMGKRNLYSYNALVSVRICI